jgi:uncharacterized protein YqeY
MALLERLQTEMVTAMKAKDEARLGTLRMMKTALKKHEVDSMKPLDEPTEMQILSMLIKQRREAADMFRKGGREELATKEESELAMIETYLPAAPSEEELDRAVSEAIAESGATSAKDMGKVMKAAQAKLAGKRVDGKVLSERVKSRLS